MNNPPDTVSHSADNRLPYVLPIGETATHGRKATPTGDEKRQNAALPVHNIPAPEADQAKYLQIHDEYDDEERTYVVLNDHTWIFEAKTQLTDF